MTDPMTTPPLDPDRLRKTAEAATKGEWVQYNPSCGESHLSIAGKVAWRSVESATPFADDEIIPHWVDANFIAAFDPPTVLALLDRVEELTAKRRPLLAALEDATDRAEAAEKKVAAVEALRNVWFRELENADHLVPLEDVIDATDTALDGGA